MDYQALYRKYRPQRFSEIVGQGHVTETLSREVVEGRVAHAYLFAGPRGTGKTTTARILAKALNCPNRGDDGEPCNECPSCVAITEGSSLDVIELDAASHNSVEDIRDMRVSVSTVASVGGAKRVFILDEAHMLSKAAGNALLKTLEEPPEHVHFVLATTEPYKLLDTIRSRAQRFDFRLIPVEVLVEHLRRISDAQGYVTDDQALATVARRAKGSARDALSLLEQVAALGDGSVDVSGVNRALGLADAEAYMTLAEAVVGNDAKIGLELVARLASTGVDLRRFVGEAIGFLRGVFLVHYAPNIAEIADEPAVTLDEWRKVAAIMPPAQVLHAVDQLSEALVQLRSGREERLMLELAVLKITRPETSTDVGALAGRLDRIEQQMNRWRRQATSGPVAQSPVVSPPPTSAPVQADTPPLQQAPASPVEPKAPVKEPTQPARKKPEPQHLEEAPPVAADTRQPVTGLTLEQFETIWPALVAAVRDELGSRRLAVFREVSPGAIEGSTVVLTVPAHLNFHLAQLQHDPSIAQIVAAHAADLLGGTIEVVFRSSDGPRSEEPDDVVPDKDQLAEAPEKTDDPAALVEGLLGGQVIEEISED